MKAKRSRSTASRNANGLTALASIRDELTSLLERNDDNAQPVAKILRLLKQMEAELNYMTVQAESLGGSRNSQPMVRSYRVEQRDQQEVLVEAWPGKTVDPFRCSQDVYMALAETIHQRRDLGVDFPELVSLTGKKLGFQPAEHHVRMCLRFWMIRSKLFRQRYRYHRTDRSHSFTSVATAEWQRLSKASPGD